MDLTPSTLRTLAEYHAGRDLEDRLAHVEDVIRQQADGLRWAADEIERLQSELDRCKSAGPTV